MSSRLGSFDRSPLAAFKQSPLCARNQPPRLVAATCPCLNLDTTFDPYGCDPVYGICQTPAHNYWSLPLTFFTNGVCASNCSALNGTYFLTSHFFSLYSTCAWNNAFYTSTSANCGVCTQIFPRNVLFSGLSIQGPFFSGDTAAQCGKYVATFPTYKSFFALVGSLLQIDLSYSAVPDGFLLNVSLVVTDGIFTFGPGGELIGSSQTMSATYFLARRSWSCLGSNTMYLFNNPVSYDANSNLLSDNLCDGWPSSLTVTWVT